MASRFWVGGTGTWDASTTTHWSASTGGAGGASAPTTGDSVTFDASSGGGTVTADSSINNLSLADITSSAFTGTLDFTNGGSPLNLTLTGGNGFAANGNGTRKYLMGTGTFTFTGTGFVWNLGGSNIDGTSNFSANYTFTGNSTASRTFQGAAKTYGALTIGSNTSHGVFGMVNSNAFSSVSLAAGTYFQMSSGITTTISNPFTWSGTSSNPILLFPDTPTSGVDPIISVSSGASTADWTGFFRLTRSGSGTFSATNSFDFGRNSSFTISPPSSGAVVGVIGG